MKHKAIYQTILSTTLGLLTQFSVAQNAPDTDESKPTKTITSLTAVAPVFDVSNCAKPEYPRAALRWEYQGTSIIKVFAAVNGKVEKLELVKSSGWKILDQAIAHSLYNCQIIVPQSAKLSQVIQYNWKIGGITDNPPQLLEETCQPTRFMRLATIKDGGIGTVVGVYVPSDGKPQRVSLEWSSGQKDLDDDSIEFLQNCKFQPATNNGKNVDGSISFRLFPRNLKPAEN